MAGLLGPRHREAHVGEEPARSAFADVPLGLRVRLGARDADGVQTQLVAQPADVLRQHARILPA